MKQENHQGTQSKINLFSKVEKLLLMEQAHGIMVNNCSSVHTDNCKNNFLVIGEGPSDDINDSIGKAEKIFSINFTKENTKLSLGFHHSGHKSYLYVKKNRDLQI